jgi:hypothetical protein
MIATKSLSTSPDGSIFVAAIIFVMAASFAARNADSSGLATSAAVAPTRARAISGALGYKSVRGKTCSIDLPRELCRPYPAGGHIGQNLWHTPFRWTIADWLPLDCLSLRQSRDFLKNSATIC